MNSFCATDTRQLSMHGESAESQRTTASICSKPFESSKYWMSSLRKRSCAVRRFKTCERGYSGCNRDAFG